MSSPAHGVARPAPTAARPAAVTGDDDRAYRELLKLGKAQQRLLSKAAPPVDGYEVRLLYRPCFVATGDYYDFFRFGDADLAIFVGDGAGHGPTASILMAMMMTILRTHPGLHGDPGPTLTRAGALFHDLTPSDLFMTGLYLRLGPDGSARWASAGSLPPLRVSRGGRVAPVDLAPCGQPMGVTAGEEFPTVVWRLEPGDRLVMFTDGIYQARSCAGEEFGRERLQQLLAGLTGAPLAEAIAEVVCRAAEHREGADFEDDFTIVGVERLP